MKLNIEFVKRNLISIIVAGSILTIGGVSVASTLLSDPSETIVETTPTATIEPTATLEPTLEPTASPIVTPLPTQAVITLDGVTINASNSVINVKDSTVNNATTTTTPMVTETRPQPTPTIVPTPWPEPIR